jgi:ammonia channel protein AmtB
VYYCTSKLILLKLRVDDPLDAIAVHAACGAWGMIGSAAFAKASLATTWFGPPPGGPADGVRASGFIMGGGGALLAAHLVYILVIAAWTLGLMVPFFLLLKRAGILRVPPDAEVAGLDVSFIYLCSVLLWWVGRWVGGIAVLFWVAPCGGARRGRGPATPAKPRRGWMRRVF